MRFNLQYGDGCLPLEINDRLKVENIQPRTIVDLPNRDFIMHSLENPTNSPSLSTLSNKAQSAIVVVNGGVDNDISKNLLTILLDSLKTQNLSPEDITILHQSLPTSPNEESKFASLLGEFKDCNHQVLLHDPHTSEDLHFVGDTPTYCTPVAVNKAFSEADLRIGIGTIHADALVSATGGRMSVIPWGAGSKSIERNLKIQATHLVGPYIIDSPVCVDLEEASKLAGLNFILNVVPDYKGNLAHVAVGDPYESWRNSLRTVKSVTDVPIQYKADISIVSAGGSVYDRSLFDAVDAVYAASLATEQGGVIILVAECPDGAGPAGFTQGISACNSESNVILLSQTGFESGMEKSRLFWSVMKSHRIILCSRLRESMVAERLHCLAVRDPQEGLELANSLIVSRPRIAIIPMGMKTLPYLDK